jgi:hypothetical protein
MIEAFFVLTVVGVAMLVSTLKNNRYREAMEMRGYKRTLRGFIKTRGPFSIEVKKRKSNKKSVLDVKVRRTDGIFPPLKLAKQRSYDIVLGEDLAIGDQIFDDMVRVGGSPDVLLSLLSRDLRREILGFVEEGREFKIEKGELFVRMRYRGVESLIHVDRAEALAERTLVVPDPNDALPRRFAEETAPRVKAHIARTLLKRRALHPEQRTEAILALRQALTQKDALDNHRDTLKALLELNDAGCEKEVLAAFDRGEDVTTDLAIIWLARYGTAAANARLKKIAEAWLGDKTRKQRCVEALAAIKERVGQFDGGEISMEGEGGAVSLAVDPRRTQKT